MAQSTTGSGFASRRQPEAADCEFQDDLSRALVVGTSPVNCVVVSRILERSGVAGVSGTPDTAVAALLDVRPGIVVLDGGADNRDCDDVLARIAEWRIEFGKKLPRVIFLSMRGASPQHEALRHAVDAVVAKPFTPESLQPVVDRLLRDQLD